tara:strand:- start:132 stop:458 length:327 start_codon:yes stop_codon:yes gene_type:complete
MKHLTTKNIILGVLLLGALYFVYSAATDVSSDTTQKETSTQIEENTNLNVQPSVSVPAVPLEKVAIPVPSKENPAAANAIGKNTQENSEVIVIKNIDNAKETVKPAAE